MYTSTLFVTVLLLEVYVTISNGQILGWLPSRATFGAYCFEYTRYFPSTAYLYHPPKWVSKGRDSLQC